MFSKKIRLDSKHKTVSVATALVLMAIEDLIENSSSEDKVVYGYQIMTHLKDSYNWNVKSGTVYPILKKLDQEMLIKKGVAKEKSQETKRQMIFYRITQKGKKLAQNIKDLNDDSLEAALSSADSKNRRLDQKKTSQLDFPRKNFSDKFLSPMLLNYDSQIAELIHSRNEIEDLDEIKLEIEKSIEQLENCKTLLQNQITRIETLKKIKQ